MPILISGWGWQIHDIHTCTPHFCIYEDVINQAGQSILKSKAKIVILLYIISQAISYPLHTK